MTVYLLLYYIFIIYLYIYFYIYRSFIFTCLIWWADSISENSCNCMSLHSFICKDNRTIVIVWVHIHSYVIITVLMLGVEPRALCSATKLTSLPQEQFLERKSVSKILPLNTCLCWLHFFYLFSEITPEGRRITKLDQILLNGNNITMLVPGGEGPEVWMDHLDLC